MERWFDSIFNPELVQWGLRGDPYLWREMREHLKDRPLPPAADAFLETLGELFRNLTGASLDDSQPVFVERYSHGGMSSGMVDPEIWRDRHLPLLAQRAGFAPRPTYADLLAAWSPYRWARRGVLESIGVQQSFRDPLGEFAEVLVARLVGGRLAANRVQKAWDVASPMGAIQVKYLANPSDGGWPNWHTVAPTEGMDWYALVLFLDLVPTAVYMFPRADLGRICGALGKRHGNQGSTVQFTKTNHEAMSANPECYEALGMKIFLLDADPAET